MSNRPDGRSPAPSSSVSKTDHGDQPDPRTFLAQHVDWGAVAIVASSAGAVGLLGSLALASIRRGRVSPAAGGGARDVAAQSGSYTPMHVRLSLSAALSGACYQVMLDRLRMFNPEAGSVVGGGLSGFMGGLIFGAVNAPNPIANVLMATGAGMLGVVTDKAMSGYRHWRERVLLEKHFPEYYAKQQQQQLAHRIESTQEASNGTSSGDRWWASFKRWWANWTLPEWSPIYNVERPKHSVLQAETIESLRADILLLEDEAKELGIDLAPIQSTAQDRFTKQQQQQ